MAYTPNQESLLATQETAVVRQSVNSILKDGMIVKRFENVLGKNTPAFIAGLLGAVNANKKLLSVEPMSVVSAGMVSATLNLSCVPTLGQSAIVPYKEKRKNAEGQWEEVQVAQFQIMTRGLVQLAQRTGQYKAINTGKVYSDEYDGEDLLSGEVMFHRERGGFRDQGNEEEIVGYFAFIRTVTGFEHTEYWTKEDILNHAKNFSKSYDKYNDTFKSGPWKDNFDAMAEKTVLKSCLNHYGPMSVNSVIAEAIAQDQKVFDQKGNGSYADNPMNDDILMGPEGEYIEQEEKAEAPASESKAVREI